MRSDTPLLTPRLFLRNLGHEDVTERYLSWLQDDEVTRYLEVRFLTHTIDAIRSFVCDANDSSHSLLFGVFMSDGCGHIGNIKLGPIDRNHGRADISLMLGERSAWGKGYATEAISAVASYGFEKLNLKKIGAGCYSNNLGSLKAFLKAGFTHEATIKDHWETAHGRQDQLLLGLSRGARLAEPSDPAARYGHVDKITFIGGGDLLLESARCARELGYPVSVILAPRHATENLPLAQTQTAEACRAIGGDVFVVDDINDWSGLCTATAAGPDALALCFGPAWIFSSQVISQFGAGMINFNGIPIPNYLGGAHYTWQILNNNRSGGCHLQEITEDLDRGDLLRSAYFSLPPTARLPRDYFIENHRAAAEFMQRALKDMRNDEPFPRLPYAILDAQRTYFPRLHTKENGYIDWQWSGADIESFCNAFDAPYIGAATFWNGTEIRLRNVRIDRCQLFHPYLSGLVVRRQKGTRVWIAVSDGLLATDSVHTSEGESLIARVREGDRFATPQDKLWHGRTFRPRLTAHGMK